MDAVFIVLLLVVGWIFGGPLVVVVKEREK